MIRQDWSSLKKLLFFQMAAGGGAAVEATATGNPLSFNTNVIKPLKSLLIPWTPVQSGTGDPSPTNVRPISGVSALNVWQTGKNMADVVGYSAYNVNDGATGGLSNDYGTTISTRSAGNEVVITQSSYPESGKASYKNGYFVVRLSPLVFGRNYDFSFDITNITSNPLDASLSDIVIYVPNGGTSVNPTITGNTLIFKNLKFNAYQSATRTTIEVRCCGMSFTLSNFMVTPANESDGVYEPYSGQTIPVVFPALGKNLFDEQYATGLIQYEGSHYWFTSQGTSAKSAIIPCEPNTTYTIKKYESSNRFYVGTTPSEPTNNMDVDFLFADNSATQCTVTTNATAHYMVVYVSTGSQGATPQMQIEKGETATSYEPYTNTVYGGSLDLVTGVLTATHYLARAKKSDFGDKATGSLDYRNTAMNTYIYPPCASGVNWSLAREQQLFNYGKVANAYSETGYGNYIGVMVYQASLGACFMRISEDVYQTMGENDTADISYELAEPITYQLTPQQITALLGDNVIWTDTNGSNTAVYLKKG